MSRFSDLMEAASKSSAAQTVDNFIAMLKKYGWDFNLQGMRGDTITISKRINKNDNDAFAQADGEYYFILSELPAVKSKSSTWGTDGGGIGALTAVKRGRFVMNKSSIRKNIVAELQRRL